jgi:hypothetical protein
MVSPRSHTPRIRAPMSVLKAPRILVALKPEERDTFARRAELSNMTLSAYARHLVLIGLQWCEADEAKGTSHA